MIAIRPAAVEDARAIATLQIMSMRARYSSIVPEAILAGYDVNEFTQARRAAIVDRRAAGGETFVAERDGTVAGFATCGTPRDDDVDGRTTGELLAIYVAPNAWRAGIGRGLVTAVETHLLSRGFGDAYLWVFEQNAVARCFYERLGYVADGSRKANDGFAGAIEIRYRRSLA